MSVPARGSDAAPARRALELACGAYRALLAQTDEHAVHPGLEEAARQRLEAHELLMDSATPLAVFDGPAHVLRFVNHAWAALLGEVASATGMRAALDQVLTTGAAVHIDELVFDASAGREVFCRAALQPVRGARGVTTGVAVVCADVTDAVIAARLGVARSPTEREALVWGGPAQHEIDYANHAWCLYTGRPGVTGAAIWPQLVHPDDVSRCLQAFGEAARRRVSTDIEARLLAGNGDHCWHRIRFTIAGPGPRWFGSAINIHHTRSAEVERMALIGRERAARADAEQANRLKDQFLAAVSHELRAPLTTMLLWEKILRDGSGDAALHAEALDAIRQSAIAQSLLVADLLDVARGISGKLFIDLRPVAIADVVHEAVVAATAAAAHKQVALSEDPGPGIGKVSGDAHRLRQVLDNVLSNAIKFTEAGGRIVVSSRVAGGAVVISVADTGRGIAPEFLARMFEPFSQTDDALTRAQGGLGLGLSIAHQLVALHAGTLVATSPGVGRGATLTITLPLGAARRGSPAPVPPPAAGVLAGIRVLVVDDDRRVRDALAILLARSGAVIAVADSAAAARVALAGAVPDAVVCDIAMPDEDGYSLVRTLRAAGLPVAGLPIIATTAHATTADAERALAAGFDLHLPKPIDVERLVERLGALVGARRVAR